MTVKEKHDFDLKVAAEREYLRITRMINQLTHDRCFWDDLRKCQSPSATIDEVRYGDPASMFTPAGVDEQDLDAKTYYDTNKNALELLKNLGLD